MPELSKCILPVVLALAFLGPGWARAEEKPGLNRGRTATGGAPWTAKSLPPGKVTYGTDDRHDVFEETDDARRALADSTCALVDLNSLVENGDGNYTLRVSAYQIFGLPACDDEPFGNQPTAAFCTGFVVGPDLIATAGHCIDTGDLSLTRFVFGFRMRDTATANTVFDATEVYSGVEIVARQLEGGFDYSIVRVDRDITAPGARILPLRTAGSIAPGTGVGVIGHPAGLPAKIAFGDTTIVRDSVNPGFFVANLDSYGGNSGSPVFNADTGVVEGILVRGESDFDFESSCFRSRNLPDDGGFGEEVSKSTTFARYVQLGRGSLTLERSSYQCSDTMDITLFDYDLEGAETAKVNLFTSGPDTETIVLQETGHFGTFHGTIEISGDTPVANNGILEAIEGMSIYVTYRDTNVGNGAPGDAVATARVDCTAPAISNVRIADVGGNRAQIAFDTDEPTAGMVLAGLECGAAIFIGEDDLTTEHLVDVRNLSMVTTYLFEVAATDAAGNMASNNNGGACFTFTTTDQIDYLTETFYDGASDLADTTITFVPDNSPSGYTACVSPANGFPTSPMCGMPLSLGDDDSVEYTLAGGHIVPFFGQNYDSFFVGSNGYVTFGEGDGNYDPSVTQHFALPRVSGYFSDLYPAEGGVINVSELDDRVAVTYFNIYDYFGSLQSFQIEMFYDGAIRITWLVQTFPYAIIGLSRGGGARDDFESSDLSGYLECADSPYEDIICDSNLPNDDCDNATAAEPWQEYTGSTVFALGSSDVGGCASCYGQDVWYTFTPESDGLYTISLCGSSFDTMLEVYVGGCGALEFFDGSDDSFCGYQSEVVNELSAGVTYRIRITGYGALAGSYALMVSPGGKGFGGCNNGEGTRSPHSDGLLVLALVLFLSLHACRQARTVRVGRAAPR